jgi:peroxiredoxin
VWTKLAPQGVQLVGIDTRDTTAGAQAFARSFGVTYPSLVDEDGELLLTFRKTLPPQSIPSSIILDRHGRVAARVLGATTEDKLTRLIQDIQSERT